MIHFVLNRIKEMLSRNCEIKDWSNKRFDFTDHTLLCYRGFKTEYRGQTLILKTWTNLQEFILCKCCRHFRCKDHFGNNKNQKLIIRRCCFDCLRKCELNRLAKIKKDNECKIHYSVIQHCYVNGNDERVQIEGLWLTDN